MISQFGLLFLELRVYILQFRLYQNCEINSQLQEIKVRTVRWNKVTITLYPLYSMAEISFHRFHMCKREKQTNIKMHSPAHILTPPLPLLLPYLSSSDPTTPLPPPTIPLPLPGIIFFSLWFFVLFCIHKTNSKRSFLLYVDVMEKHQHLTIPPTETGISYF